MRHLFKRSGSSSAVILVIFWVPFVLGDAFGKVISNGVIVGCAVFSGVRVYNTLAEFESDRAFHLVTPVTMKAEKYTKFVAAFDRAEGKLYGWMLDDYRSIEPPVEGDRCLNGVMVPKMKGQDCGHVWVRTLIPGCFCPPHLGRRNGYFFKQLAGGF